jgi:hypothetical protein
VLRAWPLLYARRCWDAAATPFPPAPDRLEPYTRWRCSGPPTARPLRLARHSQQQRPPITGSITRGPPNPHRQPPLELESVALTPEVAAALNKVHREGRTMVMVAVDDVLGGALELRASVRPEVSAADGKGRLGGENCMPGRRRRARPG